MRGGGIFRVPQIVCKVVGGTKTTSQKLEGTSVGAGRISDVRYTPEAYLGTSWRVLQKLSSKAIF